jgi:hypothetical protein
MSKHSQPGVGTQLMRPVGQACNAFLLEPPSPRLQWNTPVGGAAVRQVAAPYQRLAILELEQGGVQGAVTDVEGESLAGARVGLRGLPVVLVVAEKFSTAISTSPAPWTGSSTSSMRTNSSARPVDTNARMTLLLRWGGSDRPRCQQP